jgi:hypothetical protein
VDPLEVAAMRGAGVLRLLTFGFGFRAPTASADLHAGGLLWRRSETRPAAIFVRSLFYFLNIQISCQYIF